jgi:hypothetical protein
VCTIHDGTQAGSFQQPACAAGLLASIKKMWFSIARADFMRRSMRRSYSKVLFNEEF